MTFLYFILMLSGIILIHEFGHFIMAKLFHVYVYEFSLGMGPKLLQWKGKETKYTLRLLPLGGYVSMAGDDQPSEEIEIPENRLLTTLANWKKLCIMVAGPVMNFILAWCVFVGIYMHIGYVVDAPLAIVNGVVEGSVASEAGFTYGDEIVKVTFSDGTVIEPDDFYDITMYSQYYTDETIYTVLRNGVEVDLTVTPEFNEEEQRYMIGIVAPESHVRQLTFVETIKEGNAYFWDSVDLMIESIQMLVKGIGLDSLSGPVGIYTMTEQQVSYGFLSFLSLVGLLSLNVGFMNLLPVPMFDGGRMLITAVEMVIKRKIPERLEVALMWGSLLLIVALFILTTVNDVSRLLG